MQTQQQPKTVPYCTLHKYFVEDNKLRVKCTNKYLQEPAGNKDGRCGYLEERESNVREK